MRVRLLLLRWWLCRQRDNLAHIAAILLPKRIVYWSLIRAGVTTMGDDVIPEVPFMTVLKRWGQHANLPGHED